MKLYRKIKPGEIQPYSEILLDYTATILTIGFASPTIRDILSEIQFGNIISNFITLIIMFAILVALFATAPISIPLMSWLELRFQTRRSKKLMIDALKGVN